MVRNGSLCRCRGISLSWQRNCGGPRGFVPCERKMVQDRLHDVAQQYAHAYTVAHVEHKTRITAIQRRRFILSCGGPMVVNKKPDAGASLAYMKSSQT